MRVSKISDLRLSYIRLSENQIQIRRLKGSLGTLQSFVKINGFDEREAIEVYLKVRPEVDTDILFVSRKSSQTRDGAAPYQMNRSQASNLFAEICKEAGIEDRFAHPHVLKHSLGQLLYDSGVDLNVIQSRLGYKNINSTTRCAKLTQAQSHVRVQEALSKIF